VTARPVAVVTGASRGIGRAIALRLAPTHDIIGLARDARALRVLEEEVLRSGGSCRTVAVDLADGATVESVLADTDADVLVNNAGVAVMRPFLELSARDWHRMVNVNLNALFHVTRAVLPGMVKRKRGDVIVIGSLAGRNTFVGGSCYAATKHAVMGFAESLMLEVREHGIRVAVVMPGSVATELFPEGTDTSWMMRPADVAHTVAHVIEAPREVLLARVELRVASPQRP
jgi:NADP-dependent 3-hydroxy acid dehydrogenase YdfG